MAEKAGSAKSTGAVEGSHREGRALSPWVPLVIVATAFLSLAPTCEEGGDDTDGPGVSAAIEGSLWRVTLVYNVPLEIQNPDDDELPRRIAWYERWTADFRVGERVSGTNESETLVATYVNQSTGYPVLGWDDPDHEDWVDCPGCTKSFSLEGPELVPSASFYAQRPFPPLDLDMTEGDLGAFYIGFQFPLGEHPAERGCVVQCHHTYVYPPEPPGHHDVTEARGGVTNSFSIVVTARDHFVTTTREEAVISVRLRCIDNCPNLDCSSGCDDGSSCTEDRCVPGEGCVYDPVDGGPCQDDPCSTPGVCRGGACEGTEPLDCADDNECTEDGCVPEFGCVNVEIDKFLSNEVPDDCVMSVCFEGIRWDDAGADWEDPPQLLGNDCEMQVCSGGTIETIDIIGEPGC